MRTQAGFGRILTPASRWIDGKSTWRLFLLMFVLMHVARYGVMPWAITMLDGAAWPWPLDLSFAYSAQEAFDRIAAYGEAGRASYPYFSFTADVIYPMTYSVSFAALLSLLARRFAVRWHWLMWLNVLPVGVFVLDMLENISIAVLMLIYPAQPVALALAASVFSTGKWVFVGLMIGASLALGAWQLLQLAKAGTTQE